MNFARPSKWPLTAHLDCCGGPVSGSLQRGGKPQCPKRYQSFWSAKLAFVILASLHVAPNSSAIPKEKGQKLTLVNIGFIHLAVQSAFFFFFVCEVISQAFYL